jgi:thymidylate kinase
MVALTTTRQSGRGLLIAVEGCDRGGKTTQCKLLQDWLQENFKVSSEYVKFPGKW